MLHRNGQALENRDHCRPEWGREDDICAELPAGGGGLSGFINADLIAVGLSPFDPSAAAIRAGRLMMEEIKSACASAEASPLRPRSVV
jgi:hypothetical protein